jgi:ribonucleotide monophosphatase NagD (HAD superfamily)
MFYVGDHPVHDVLPAKVAGLATCLIRRGLLMAIRELLHDTRCVTE